MIIIKNLDITYPGKRKVKAVDNVSLEIKKGEIFGIIGLSGAGKSSLLRAINGLVRPTSGEVWVDGVEITRLSSKELLSLRQKIGMIFQHFNLLDSRTVFGNVAFPLEIGGYPRERIKKRVMEVLELVGLLDKADSYPRELSGGQKQRVGIARAIAANPKILLCDEPTSALDPQTTGQILKLLAEINRKLGITIVIITHEMRVITEICDRVAVMDNGRVVEEGVVTDVFLNPWHPITKEFVNTVISKELPEEVLLQARTKRPDREVLLLRFAGNTANEPVVSRIIKETGVELSILYGNIGHLKDVPYGILAVEIFGDENKRDKVRQILHELSVKLEVV
ncbi:methionine import ATP-binding protein MetN [Carboxydothermus islandicus]|uniref:Methionine import ATP-binding protein MetN n=1 Tax=Carboxydothermus islandicus TaxID=661089 RepID=A0A1L8D4H9_9THEO|nr:methionine ABC transporter ATP-binding protein [Carboxydothermus islandicus]GAV26007.1 methionine import ATP-binding protein MetN [Carboxydothermus islandicus]